MPDNSPKALRAAITALATELQSLKSENARTAGDIHRLLRDAPWKHEPHANGPQDNADNNGKTAPRQPTLTNNGTNNGGHQPEAGGAYRKPWWIRMWVWQPWKRGLAVLAGLASIGYAIVTYRQWHDLRHNFEVDQRAWIAVSVGFPDGANPPIFGVPIRVQNLGKSIATHIHVFSRLECLSAEEAPHLHPTPGLAISDITVGLSFPTDSTPYPMQFADSKGNPRNLTDAEVKALMDGKAYLALSGILAYEDQFGKHWTKFCRWHDYATIQANVNARSCTEWNEVGDGPPPAR